MVQTCVLKSWSELMLGLCTAKQWPGGGHSLWSVGFTFSNIIKAWNTQHLCARSKWCPPSVSAFCPSSHYMRQILEALRYCHDNNVIHRDVKVSFRAVKLVKPQNMFRDSLYVNTFLNVLLIWSFDQMSPLEIYLLKYLGIYGCK